jgi:hypothetical protein
MQLNDRFNDGQGQYYNCVIGASLETIDEKSKSELEQTMLS